MEMDQFEKERERRNFTAGKKHSRCSLEVLGASKSNSHLHDVDGVRLSCQSSPEFLSPQIVRVERCNATFDRFRHGMTLAVDFHLDCFLLGVFFL